jgi:hypothetical protein
MFSQRREFGRPQLSLDLSPEGVYGPILVAQQFHCVVVTQSRYVRIMPAVLSFLVCSLCLAACGGSGASTSTTASSSPTTKAIVTAWLAAQKAFDTAAITSDANSPDLAVTMISPQLDHVRKNLATFASLGYGARGPTFYGNPKVQDVRDTQAEVVSCVHGEEIEIDLKTGKPVSGVLGRSAYELVKSAMRRTPNGWKLANQSVDVGGCSRS